MIEGNRWARQLRSKGGEFVFDEFAVDGHS